MIAQQVSEKFDKFYNVLGPEKCKAHGYKTSDIQREIDFLTSKDRLILEFGYLFKISQRYTNAEAKEMIRQLYKKLGIKKTPKAVDLVDYFNVKKVLMTIDGKKVNGIEILGLKS
jgi:hypothetical protein